MSGNSYSSGLWSTRLTKSAVLILALLLTTGCGRQADEAATASKESNPARSEVKRGPVRVCVEVDPPKARLSDEPLLTLTIDYEQGVKIKKPPFGESLGDFIIRDFREPLPQVKDGREIIQQIYTLEPTRTGDLFIQPISVSFTDSRPEGDGKQHTIETEGLTVKIASVVDAKVPSLGDLRPAAGPIELPEPRSWTVWWLAALGTVALAALVWWLRRRRCATTQEKPLSPQELAYLELERLLERRLAEEDVKLYYVELTGVVRRYIERTTQIRAPEQTTEEFLREVGRRQTFPADESRRLQLFLESADLVKFAAHRPRAEDIEESFQRAKAFIGLQRQEVAA